MNQIKSGIELVQDERNKQLFAKGRTAESDAKYNAEYQLKDAAQALLHDNLNHRVLSCPNGWNLDQWRKLAKKEYSQRCRIAAALLCAELDRLSFTIIEHFKAGELAKLDNVYEDIKSAVNGSLGFNTSPEAKIVLDELVKIRDIAAENIVK